MDDKDTSPTQVNLERIGEIRKEEKEAPDTQEYPVERQPRLPDM